MAGGTALSAWVGDCAFIGRATGRAPGSRLTSVKDHNLKVPGHDRVVESAAALGAEGVPLLRKRPSLVFFTSTVRPLSKNVKAFLLFLMRQVRFCLTRYAQFYCLKLFDYLSATGPNRRPSASPGSTHRCISAGNTISSA